MLHTIAETTEMIRSGRNLLLAGEEDSLLKLPKGNWIAGTIPYFMTQEGGRMARESVFVTELPAEVESVGIATYDVGTLPGICEAAPEHGFTVLILPAWSAVHLDYAHGAPDYPQMYLKPIIGWVSGVHLQATTPPRVVDGRTGTSHTDRALAMHCTLAAGCSAHIGIVNLFRPGEGDSITFPADGFHATECWVNGVSQSFATYLKENGIDTKLPLVANCCGAMVNVSIQRVDPAGGCVDFYAPVFQGVAYKLASPVGDYVAEFLRAVPPGIEPAFSCNCILNYVYSELEGKVTKGLYGPFTFGEIAYQLLNQTLVYLTIDKA